MTTARALFIVALIAGILFIGGIWRVGNQQAEIERQGDQNAKALAALCAFKDDLARRIAAGNEFLREHPHGIPGIPASVLRDSIRNQQRTLDTIAPYLSDCRRTTI